MSGKLKTAVALLVLLGLSDIALFPASLGDGNDKPPLVVGILTLVVGIGTIAAAAGLVRGDRRARTTTYVLRAVDAVSAVPAFFVDVNGGLVTAAVATIVISALAVVLVARSVPSPASLSADRV